MRWPCRADSLDSMLAAKQACRSKPLSRGLVWLSRKSARRQMPVSRSCVAMQRRIGLSMRGSLPRAGLRSRRSRALGCAGRVRRRGRRTRVRGFSMQLGFAASSLRLRSAMCRRRVAFSRRRWRVASARCSVDRMVARGKGLLDEVRGATLHGFHSFIEHYRSPSSPLQPGTDRALARPA
jgi:hypothetical protein